MTLKLPGGVETLEFLNSSLWKKYCLSCPGPQLLKLEVYHPEHANINWYLHILYL